MIKRLPVGDLGTNCYLIFGDEDPGRVLIVDPGDEGIRIKAALNGAAISAVLLTHGHFDHTGALCDFKDCPIYIGDRDADMLTKPDINAGFLCSDTGIRPPATNRLLGGECLHFDGFALPVRVISSPGHTPGGLVYRYGEDLFTGDTLFKRGYGRTDLWGGNEKDLVLSLRRLMALEGALKVHPGHGPETTLGEEQRFFRAMLW